MKLGYTEHMKYLSQITILLPDQYPEFADVFTTFLLSCAERCEGGVSFKQSHAEYLPQVKLQFATVNTPQVHFELPDGRRMIELKNSTGMEKKSPHAYTPIMFSDFLERMQQHTIQGLDHLGFDIPWFDGVHPEIVQLRESLKTHCLYYLFPTGEAWDFILPGTPSEMQLTGDPDLTVVRRPKFELVSIDTVSTPLLQFEFKTSLKYSEMVQLFPEAIAVPEVPNVWVYIQNSYGVDICCVLNEHSENDWCAFFGGHRL